MSVERTFYARHLSNLAFTADHGQDLMLLLFMSFAKHTTAGNEGAMDGWEYYEVDLIMAKHQNGPIFLLLCFYLECGLGSRFTWLAVKKNTTTKKKNKQIPNKFSIFHPRRDRFSGARVSDRLAGH